jgi:hypothetical protein
MLKKLLADPTIEFLGFVGFNDKCSVRFLPGEDISDFHGALVKRNGKIILETFGSAYLHEIGASTTDLFKAKETQVFKASIETGMFSAYAFKTPPPPLTDSGRTSLIEDMGLSSFFTNSELKLAIETPLEYTQILKLQKGPSDLEDYQEQLNTFLQTHHLRFAQVEWGQKDTNSPEELRVVLVGKKSRPNLQNEFEALFPGSKTITAFYPKDALKIGGMMCNSMCPPKVTQIIPTSIQAECIYANTMVSLDSKGHECDQVGILYINGPLDFQTFSQTLPERHQEKSVLV